MQLCADRDLGETAMLCCMRAGALSSEQMFSHGAAPADAAGNGNGNGNGAGAELHAAMRNYDSTSDDSDGSGTDQEEAAYAFGDDADGYEEAFSAEQQQAASEMRAAGLEPLPGGLDNGPDGGLDFAEASPGALVGQPRQTAVIEQCVAWGGEQRVRFQLTLAVAGAHVSANVLGIESSCRQRWSSCCQPNAALLH